MPSGHMMSIVPRNWHISVQPTAYPRTPPTLLATTTAAVLLLLFVVVMNMATAAAAATTASGLSPIMNVTVCNAIADPGLHLHAEYALHHMPDLALRHWPNLTILPTVVVGSYLNLTPFAAVREYIAAAGDVRCDVTLGPGWSDLSAAISPLIGRALWVDYAATSTQLSNRASYPNFLRTIPTDAQGGAAIAALLFGMRWKSAFLLKATTAYGETLGASVVDEHARRGGSIVRTYNVLSADNHDAALETLVLDMAAQTTTATRIVIVVDINVTALSVIVTRHRLEARLVFLFAEYAATATLWPGCFLLSVANNATQLADYLQRYHGRSDAVFNASIATFVERGIVSYEDAAANWRDYSDVYTNLIVDTVWYALSLVQHAFVLQQQQPSQTMPSDSVAWAQYASSSGFQFPGGLTGAVGVTATGERAAFLTTIQNVGASGVLAEAGLVQGDGSLAFTQPVYVLGASYSVAATTAGAVPSDRDTSNDGSNSSKNSTAWYVWLLIALLCAAGLFAALFAAAKVVAWARRVDPAQYAPKNEDEPITFLFSDIESSTALWASCPLQMGAALDHHNAVIRECIARFRGYEVKTIGDSFMVAFKSAASAASCALEIQQCLHSTDWDALEVDADTDVGEALNQFYLDHRRHDVDGGSEALWNGLRVRIGLHTGFATIRRVFRDAQGNTTEVGVNNNGDNENTPPQSRLHIGSGGTQQQQQSRGSGGGNALDDAPASYDYLGPSVNLAARVESVGHGGQIIATAAMIEALGTSVRGIGITPVASPRFKEGNNDTEREHLHPQLQLQRSQSLQSSQHAAEPDGSSRRRADIEGFLRAVRTPLGIVHVRGLEEGVELVQLAPPSLAQRAFPALRIDRANGAGCGEADMLNNNNNNGDSSGGGTTVDSDAASSICTAKLLGGSGGSTSALPFIYQPPPQHHHQHPQQHYQQQNSINPHQLNPHYNFNASSASASSTSALPFPSTSIFQRTSVVRPPPQQQQQQQHFEMLQQLEAPHHQPSTLTIPSLNHSCVSGGANSTTLLPGLGTASGANNHNSSNNGSQGANNNSNSGPALGSGRGAGGEGSGRRDFHDHQNGLFPLVATTSDDDRLRKNNNGHNGRVSDHHDGSGDDDPRRFEVATTPDSRSLGSCQHGAGGGGDSVHSRSSFSASATSMTPRGVAATINGLNGGGSDGGPLADNTTTNSSSNHHHHHQQQHFRNSHRNSSVLTAATAAGGPPSSYAGTIAAGATLTTTSTPGAGTSAATQGGAGTSATAAAAVVADPFSPAFQAQRHRVPESTVRDALLLLEVFTSVLPRSERSALLARVAQLWRLQIPAVPAAAIVPPPPQPSSSSPARSPLSNPQQQPTDTMSVMSHHSLNTTGGGAGGTGTGTAVAANNTAKAAASAKLQKRAQQQQQRLQAQREVQAKLLFLAGHCAGIAAVKVREAHLRYLQTQQQQQQQQQHHY